MNEILIEGPFGIMVMPASSGIQELSNLGEGQKTLLLSELDAFERKMDFLLIDTGAGISSNVMYFNLAAQERVVVVSPEPTSITDAYALIKVMASKYNEKKFKILPNMVSGVREAKAVYSLLTAVADQHLATLAISMDYLGFIPRDEMLVKAVKRQKAVIEAFPGSGSGKSFVDLADMILRASPDTSLDGNIKFFWRRLLKV